MPNIHPSAIVEDGARIADDVTIGPFCYVQNDTSIGPGSMLKSHVCVHAHSSIGANTSIHAGAVIGDLPQDLEFDPGNISTVTIGDDCVIREGVTIHRGTKHNTGTVVGNGCFLMGNSHVAHNCTLGDRVIFANGVLLGGYVTIGDGAFLSGNAMVHQFCKVGRLAMMSGLCAISKDLPPFFITHGVTGNAVSGINTVGLRRAGFSPQARSAIKNVFRRIYLGKKNLGDTLAELELEELLPEAKEVVDFIKTSERGICKYNG
jgi:UDP-N-acetylglucosamine acyltransferase